MTPTPFYNRPERANLSELVAKVKSMEIVLDEP